MPTELPAPPLTAAQEKRRRQRNLAIAVSIAALVAIFYAITVFKLGSNALIRPN